MISIFSSLELYAYQSYEIINLFELIKLYLFAIFSIYFILKVINIQVVGKIYFHHNQIKIVICILSTKTK